jgi:hypothetical protein
MVAFVPQRDAAQPMVVAEAPYAMRGAYAEASVEDGLHAVDTKAIVPVRRMSMTRPARHAAPAHFVMTASAEAATAGMHMVNMKATIPVSQAAQPQELLVVTLQMPTPVRTQDFKTQAFKTQDFRAQNVADYDDGKSIESTGTANAAQGKPANEMAVTKMFLGVYRASETAKAAGQSTNQKTTPADGNTSRPAVTATDLKILENRQPAVSFGDGWIVIQL